MFVVFLLSQISLYSNKINIGVGEYCLDRLERHKLLAN